MIRWLPLPTAALLAVAVGACGSSNAAYCGDRQDLRDAVDQLPQVNVRENGVDALRTQVQTIQNDAKTLISSAKSDFPEQTSAIRTSVDGLKSALQAVPSSPTPGDLAAVGTAVAGIVRSVNAFVDASADEC